MTLLRNTVTFLLLVVIKTLSQIFFRVRFHWLGNPPQDPWADLRVVAILHHTSLFEPVFAGGCPYRFLWRIARHTVVPVAKVTMDRPVVGRFFRFIAGHVVSITRKRDDTWKRVLAKVDDEDIMVIILPEGRMMRKDGLDSKGRPMTVRAGVADILREVDDGRLLLAYSGGLHHVQAPGETFPRLFKTVEVKLENLDLAAYRRERMARYGEEGFTRAVIEDLTRRRDRHCPRVSNHPDVRAAQTEASEAEAAEPPPESLRETLRETSLETSPETSHRHDV